jgi:hypothetical protein
MLTACRHKLHRDPSSTMLVVDSDYMEDILTFKSEDLHRGRFVAIALYSCDVDP